MDVPCNVKSKTFWGKLSSGVGIATTLKEEPNALWNTVILSLGT